MYYKELQNNPLTKYEDLAKAFLDTIKPYMPFLSPGCARIDTGPPGATFSHSAVCLEGFARILWGLAPYLAGGNIYTDMDKIISGITNGVNPEHGEFWGWPGDYDQLLVEMAVFGYALCIIPDIIWKPLSQKAKKNFARWLSSINKKKIPDCNWVFFRILVNCGLKKAGAKEFDTQLLEESLEQVDEFSIGNGWYNDGFPHDRRSRDYYIPWALHYYGLIFAVCCADLYPDKAGIFKERAALFAGDFRYWFARDGSSLPYGRSLTYRYAQAAFWGALAFAGIEALPWGQVKGLFLRNLRWWFGQPAFSETGLLTIGYTYPNLCMAERYNSPNSPLWACKAFIPLAIAKDHVFWQTGEEPLEKPETTHIQEPTGFIIHDSEETGHLYALNNGQWTPGISNEHNHMAEKYAKFAYSTYFGFNVTTDTYGIDKSAHDNMLCISTLDRHYYYRKETHDHFISRDYCYSSWKPCEGIHIETYLVPCGPWSLRFHHIKAETPFTSAEGGFALPFDDAFYPVDETIHRETENSSYRKTACGFSGIVDVYKKQRGKIIIANPNSNIIHPRTLIPTLLGEYTSGEYFLGCAVMAHPDPGKGEKLWQEFDIKAITAGLSPHLRNIFGVSKTTCVMRER
ncbi:MAG: DUF2264 domain-containing protein [Spirochaetales bacterium]|nr:DUF2264 domain-containing protein [Spirochaetales bacterium]